MHHMKIDIPQPFSRDAFWADFIQRNGFHAVAEIGVWRGEFAKALLDACPGITAYWMIDPWRRLPGWNKPFNTSDEEFALIHEAALAATAGHQRVRHVLHGTTAEVVDNLPDGSLDFVYVDGDHTLRGITIDLLRIWPKVRDGGAVGGDDCVPSAWQHQAGYEPTFVSPWVAYFAEAMQAPLTILPDNQFLIHKRTDGFRMEDLSGSRRSWSVAAHLGAAPARSAPERWAPWRRVSRAARHAVIRSLWRVSPRFREWFFPREVRATGLLFIHVPKTAGTSIHMALYGRTLSHDSLAAWQETYPRSMAGIRTAAVVRDPVDRFLSAFHYLKRGGMNSFDAEFASRYLQPFATPGDLADAMERTDVQRWLLCEGFHFRPQADFLRDRSGAVRIDHLFAYERLDDAAARLSDILGRSITFPHLNRTDRPDLSLTNQQVRRVRSIYAEDVALHQQALAGSESNRSELVHVDP